jgi:hypothetical protein
MVGLTQSIGEKGLNCLGRVLGPQAGPAIGSEIATMAVSPWWMTWLTITSDPAVPWR